MNAQYPLRNEGGRKPLLVGCIQVSGHTSSPTSALEEASRLVAEAADAGAQLVLCPELLAVPYTLGPDLWDSTESRGGLTERWLCEMAKRHRIHIGAGYLEDSGRDLFNTFTLLQPDGVIAGRVRKRSHGFLEGPLFRNSLSPRVIPTRLGRIGVGICFDNYLRDCLAEFREAEVDLILMPHCWPSQPHPNRFALLMDSLFHRIAAEYAQFCNAPVLLSNKGGAVELQGRIPGRLFAHTPLRFDGGSRICDADGATIASFDAEVGVLTATVGMDLAPLFQRVTPPPAVYWSIPPDRSRWILAGAHLLLTRWGRIRYRFSRRKRGGV